MEADTNASALGVAASGAVNGNRAQRDIEKNGHPFSFAEVEPLNLWRRICEHHNITHVVDFTLGSAALATTAAGAFEYEGVAATDEHAVWLNWSLDRCFIYLAGKDKNLAQQLGGDDAPTEKGET